MTEEKGLQESGKKPFISKIPGFRSGKWWKKIIASIGYFFILLIIIGALLPGQKNGDNEVADVHSSRKSETSLEVEAETESEPGEIAEPEPIKEEAATKVEEKKPEPKKEEVAPKVAEKETVSQKNAVRKAKDYLSLMGFSRKGLIEQLEFEGFSNEDAAYAADKINANWKEQAVRKAEDYLNLMGFSRKGLIEQLEFEGFSKEDAAYAADKMGF